jgi:hypothetical protein
MLLRELVTHDKEQVNEGPLQSLGGWMRRQEGASMAKKRVKALHANVNTWLGQVNRQPSVEMIKHHPLIDSDVLEYLAQNLNVSEQDKLGAGLVYKLLSNYVQHVTLHGTKLPEEPGEPEAPETQVASDTEKDPETRDSGVNYDIPAVDRKENSAIRGKIEPTVAADSSRPAKSAQAPTGTIGDLLRQHGAIRSAEHGNATAQTRKAKPKVRRDAATGEWVPVAAENRFKVVPGQPSVTIDDTRENARYYKNAASGEWERYDKVTKHRNAAIPSIAKELDAVVATSAQPTQKPKSERPKDFELDPGEFSLAETKTRQRPARGKKSLDTRSLNEALLHRLLVNLSK